MENLKGKKYLIDFPSLHLICNQVYERSDAHRDREAEEEL